MDKIRKNKFIIGPDEIEIRGEKTPSDEELKEAETVFKKILKDQKR